MTKTGLERLLTESDVSAPLRGKRLGLLANQAAVTRSCRPAIAAFRSQELDIVKLFAPEHGFWGHAQDMEAVAADTDPVSELPVKSLYGSEFSSLSPRKDDLDGLDAVLVDLPDIGTRYYTFAATAVYLARLAQQVGVEVWILDRPNPLGGDVFEGNLVESGFESFVGAIAVPNRHGLTLAELLRYESRFGETAFEFYTVPVTGWRRSDWLDMTGLPWVMPSPNMPTLDTAAIYAGMCLLEATNVSEGRGTTRPFELFGAPFVDAVELADFLTCLELPGVHFRPLLFKPMFQKWGGRTCGGVHVHVVDRASLEPYRLGVSIIWALNSLYPDDFAWRDQPYEFVRDIPAIDLLCGTASVRVALESGAKLAEVVARAMAGADVYPIRRDKVRLYD